MKLAAVAFCRRRVTDDDDDDFGLSPRLTPQITERKALQLAVAETSLGGKEESSL